MTAPLPSPAPASGETTAKCIQCGRSNPPGGVGQRGTSGWRCVNEKACDILRSVEMVRRDAERFPNSGHSHVRHALADRLERYAAVPTPAVAAPDEAGLLDYSPRALREYAEVIEVIGRGMDEMASNNLDGSEARMVLEDMGDDCRTFARIFLVLADLDPAALVTARQEAEAWAHHECIENATLRAKLAERERDAARLDWLEKHSWRADNDGDLKGPREMPKLYVGRDRSTPPITAHTMRAVIDVAVAAATPATDGAA